MSLPRMSWHIGDYKRDTGHLRAAGHGAYFLLTMHYWATGGLPNDDRQLAAIACMSDREWKSIRPTIEAFFQPGWRHKRIDKELAEANAKYERRALAGQKGGNAKALLKQTAGIATSNAVAMTKQPITDNPNLEERKEDTANAVPSSKYAFEAGIIRLTTKDFQQWKENFSYLDLGAELLARRQWAEEQGPSKWFFAMSGALAKKNREEKLRLEQLKQPQPAYKWASGMEGIT